MLAAVLLSQHRFGDAIAEANKAMAIDPRDAWNYGAAGDGYMELGDYPRAFEAFDRMGQLQPGPPAYARTSYALEIKGDLDGALEYMRRAADGTSPNDAESQAWHFVQIGELLLQLGRGAEARREFERADATFPGHPLAVTGLARIKMIDGDLPRRALDAADAAGENARRPIWRSRSANYRRRSASTSRADQYYQMAEQIERGAWGNGLKQPQVLARLLSGASWTRAPKRSRLPKKPPAAAPTSRRWIRWRGRTSRTARVPTRKRRRRRHCAPARATPASSVMRRDRPRRPSRRAAATSPRAPGATRRCLEWHP